MTKPKYKVWEPENTTVDDAGEYKAGSPSEAAEDYADGDSDGQADGLYWDNPVRIHVQCPLGELHRFKVSASVSMMAWDDDDEDPNR